MSRQARGRQAQKQRREDVLNTLLGEEQEMARTVSQPSYQESVLRKALSRGVQRRRRKRKRKRVVGETLQAPKTLVKEARREEEEISRQISSANQSSLRQGRRSGRSGSLARSHGRGVEDDEFEVPEGAYDSVWDSEDERRLRKYWKREHEVILNHTQAHELSLWKKTYQIFGLAPPELIPSHIALDISEKKGVPDPGNDKLESDEVLVNTNWAPDTSIIFCRIVCCPAFKGRVDYLRYVLAYALYLRIGSSEEFPKPYRADYLVSGRQQLAGEIVRRTEGATVEDVLAAMETVQGTEHPPHHKFLDILRVQARGRNGKVETKALIRQDLAAIVKAWDTYAEELDSGLDLKHMADYATAWNNKHQKSKEDPKLPGEKYSTPAMLRLKKAYMISQWRESNKSQRRLAPNGRRRVVQGPDGARQQRLDDVSDNQGERRARKQYASSRRGHRREASEELGGTSVPETPNKPREQVNESVVDLVSRGIKIKPPSEIPIWGRN
jgi:hypothetical protein